MEDPLIVVDTDVIIDFFRGISPAADVFAELISSDKAAMTAISVFELYAGIEGAKRLRQIETLVQEITVLPLNVIEAAMGGRIYTQLKSRGKLIGTHDILIAAICIANDLPLYTKNIAHFSEIKDIRLLSPSEILPSRET
ncbi:MAG: type II toxin-antitoxin system VapC family toxin [Deltaproteobacteria bacterium]|nr:type II toxin-antitoxin system VapC family toxin [Deltaproteobacteria bacterium]